MRRFTITAFAIIYAALIVFSSTERVGEWAIKEAESFTHIHGVHLFKAFGKSEKRDSCVFQTRLVETGFVVELPREAADSPVPSERHIIRPLADFYISPFAELISSRAPPAPTSLTFY